MAVGRDEKEKAPSEGNRSDQMGPAPTSFDRPARTDRWGDTGGIDVP